MTYFDAAMKERYNDRDFADLTYDNHPFLSMVNKNENFVGDVYIQPLKFGNSHGGRSATIATAISNKGYGRTAKFQITHVKDYGVGSIDNLVIETSKTNEGAFLPALEFEMEAVTSALGQSLSKGLFGNSGGAIGQIGSFNGTSITLKLKDDIYNFELGMILQSSATDGTSGAVNAGTATITAIDHDSGTLTASTAGIPGMADDDYIFMAGDFGSKMEGLAGWLPMTAPTSGDSFFSLDRSVDTDKLAGLRIKSVDISGLPIEEKLLYGATKVCKAGGTPDVIFVSYENYRDLEISMQGRVVYQSLSFGQAFFSSIVIAGPKGNIKVVADSDCPADRAYCLTMKSWDLVSAGPAPHVLDRDGVFSREATSDGYEFRLAFYGNLACNAPGWNAVMDLS